MDKWELSDEENAINNEIFNEGLKDQVENGNNIINNNLYESDDDIVNISKDEDKKINLINSDFIKEGENLVNSLDLDNEIDNIGFDNDLMDLYSNFNDYNIPLIDRLLIKENAREDLKKRFWIINIIKVKKDKKLWLIQKMNLSKNFWKNRKEWKEKN